MLRMADAIVVMLFVMCCRGHLSQGRALMAPYLPRNGASGSPYSEGGALYALGLIHANHGQDIRDFLLESLRGTQNEVIADETHFQGLFVACSLSHDIAQESLTVPCTVPPTQHCTTRWFAGS
jgi:hypothetical protein